MYSCVWKRRRKLKGEAGKLKGEKKQQKKVEWRYVKTEFMTWGFKQMEEKQENLTL